MIMPVIIGVTGIVTKGLRKHLKAVPGDHSRLTTTAVLGTSHIIGQVLQSKT
jgi:hypothetical protein